MLVALVVVRRLRLQPLVVAVNLPPQLVVQHRLQKRSQKKEKKNDISVSIYFLFFWEMDNSVIIFEFGLKVKLINKKLIYCINPILNTVSNTYDVTMIKGSKTIT